MIQCSTLRILYHHTFDTYGYRRPDTESETAVHELRDTFLMEGGGLHADGSLRYHAVRSILNSTTYYEYHVVLFF
jgi:hypothetical protein